MYLKKLEMQGFKSFPEKVTIDFHQGITAIVGPNGSGKSNITDAIRWVLGEQSVRTLRGVKMEDVIFTGTQSRRAMSFAEVTIVLDNSDGLLPIEYTEVSITRRLYRSGESEYLINKVSSRLKDIQQLFMDTGIGRDGYSIIGQGKVDEILSPRSLDRRKVLEEAAGIVKFKSRRDEAQRKLENTSANLVRINDIIAEIEDRIGPLEEQSKAAKEFLLLRDELKSIEVAVFLDNIGRFTQRLDEYAEEYDLIVKEINTKTLEIENLKSLNRTMTSKTEANNEQMDFVRNLLQATTDKIREQEQTIELKLVNIQTLEERILGNSGANEDLSKSILLLEEEMGGRSEKEEYLQKQLALYRDKLDAHEKEMAEVLASLGKTEVRAEEIKLRMDELAESLYDKRLQARQTRGQIDVIGQREVVIEKDIMLRINEQDLLKVEKEEAGGALANIEGEKKTLSEQADKIREKLEAARKKAEEAIELRKAEQDKADSLTYRAGILTDLENRAEGYNAAVKAVIALRESGNYSQKQIPGTIAQLIRTEQKYNLAIETALGAALQNIVTDTEETASDLIAYLKKIRGGRATFLPVSSIRGRSPEKDLAALSQRAPGFLGFADELVSCKDEIREIISGLLARIVVMESLDQAIDLARKSAYRIKLVTLEGDVINPGGALTGGHFKSESRGILGRAAEIEELKAQALKASRQAEKLTDEIKGHNALLQELGQELFTLDEKLNEIGHEHIRREARFNQVEKDLSRAISGLAMLKGERESLSHQRVEINTESDTLEKEALLSEEKIAELREELKLIQSGNKEEELKRDELRDLISDLKISVNSIEESLQSARELSERVEQEKNRYLSSIQKMDEDNLKFSQDIESLKADIEELRADIERLQAEEADQKEKLDQLNMAKKEMETELSGFYKNFENLANELALRQGDLGRAEGRKIRTEQSLDDVKSRLWEQYELTMENADKWAVDLKTVSAPNRRIGELKESIKDLGIININAIEEYAQVSERYEFLKEQGDDIEETKEKLNGIIEEITEEMQKQFVENFSIINENFKEVFSELFGGGMAEIVLGGEDVLSADIDIIAQPPGKRLQNMLLLSGGEKCLTAIALLFAILKLKPSPFCVLDEIEAALDDVNILRFGEYVLNYTDSTQFILVTHRKGTMEIADMLYGVTMQERGISKILSMKLSD